MNKIAMLSLIGLLMPVSATAGTATVTVPANAGGNFGNPTTGVANMVAALNIKGPGSVKITYQSGTLSDFGFPTIGPNGVPYDIPDGGQLPLQERAGIRVARVVNFDALIGAFVPASIANQTSFVPTDATKGGVTVGIQPSDLFFVGKYTSIEVSGPGTVFLGINDSNGNSNTGSYTVTVSGP